MASLRASMLLASAVLTYSSSLRISTLLASAVLTYSYICNTSALVSSRENCVLLADCYAKWGDIITESGNDGRSKYSMARYYVTRQEDYESSQDASIDKECRERRQGCQEGYKGDAVKDMMTKGKNFVDDDILALLAITIYESTTSCFDYNLYFCRMDDPQQWPKDLFDAIKLKYGVKCGSTCGQFQLFHSYHQSLGKTFPDDFPINWKEQSEWDLNRTKEMNSQVEFREMPDLETNWSWEDWLEEWSQSCKNFISTNTTKCWLKGEEKPPAECFENDSQRSKFGVREDALYIVNGKANFRLVSVSDHQKVCSSDVCIPEHLCNKYTCAFVPNCTFTRCVYRAIDDVVIDHKCFQCQCNKKEMALNTTSVKNDSLESATPNSLKPVFITPQWTSEHLMELDNVAGRARDNDAISQCDLYTWFIDFDLIQVEPKCGGVQYNHGTQTHSQNFHSRGVCNNSYRPFTGSLILGMKFALHTGKQFKYIVAASFLCSGTGEWSNYFKWGSNQVYESISGLEEKEPMKCPHLMALCKMKKILKDEESESTHRTVNVILECCGVDWDSYYSGTEVMDPEIKKSNLHLQPFTNVINGEPVTKLYMCSAGEFIHKIEISNLILPYLGPNNFPGGTSYSQTREYPQYIVQLMYYCRGLFQHSVSKPLSKELYTHFKNVTRPSGTSSGITTIDCQNGYVYRIAKNETLRSGSSKSGECYEGNPDYYNNPLCGDIRDIQYSMSCSDGKKAILNGIEPTTVWRSLDVYSRVGAYRPPPQVAECPPKHGLCGVEASLQSLEHKFVFINNKFEKVKNSPLLMTTHGYFLTYKCCPIPVRIMEKECPNGVEYNIVENIKAKELCTRSNTGSCKFSKTTGHIVSEQLTLVTPVHIESHYPDLKADLTGAMVKYARKNFSSGFWTLLTFKQNDVYLKLSTVAQGERSKRYLGAVGAGAGYSMAKDFNQGLGGLMDDISAISPDGTFKEVTKGLGVALKSPIPLFGLIGHLINPKPDEKKILNEKLDEILGASKQVVKKLGNVDEKLGNVDKKLGSVDEKLDKVDEKLGNIDGKLGTIDAKLWSADIKLTRTNQILDSINSRLQAMELGLETKESLVDLYTESEEHVVTKGSRAFMYDLVVSCGESLKYMPGIRVRYIRPPFVCNDEEVKEDYVRLDVEVLQTPPQVDTIVSLINHEYGVKLDGEGPDDISRYIPWETLTSQRETSSFEQAQNLRTLGFQGRGILSRCSYAEAPSDLFQRPSIKSTFYANFTLKAGHLVDFYRIKATCGEWKIFTNMIFATSGRPEDGFNFAFPDFNKYKLTRLVIYTQGRKHSDGCFP